MQHIQTETLTKETQAVKYSHKIPNKNYVAYTER